MTGLNFVHLHLAINHSPLYSELFAFFLVLIGVARKNRILATAGLVFCVIAALAGFAADFTGDQAKDILRSAPPIAGLDKQLIEPHDAAATNFLIAASITGMPWSSIEACQ